MLVTCSIGKAKEPKYEKLRGLIGSLETGKEGEIIDTHEEGISSVNAVVCGDGHGMETKSRGWIPI